MGVKILDGEETREKEGTRYGGRSIMERGKFLERPKSLGPGLNGKEGLLFHCDRKRQGANPDSLRDLEPGS